MKDISAAVDAIEAASKAAHLSVHRRKKVRTDASGGQSADLDLEIARSTPRGTSTQRTSTTSATGIDGGASSNGSAQAPLDHPDEGFTRPSRATSNPIATSTASGIPINTGTASRTPSDTGTMYVPFEKGEISSLIHLLKYVELFPALHPIYDDLSVTTPEMSNSAVLRSSENLLFRNMLYKLFMMQTLFHTWSNSWNGRQGATMMCHVRAP